VAPSLLAALEAAVEDVVAATSAAGLGNGADGVGWVDLSPLLPSVLSEADVAVLLARMPFLQDQDRRPVKERKVHVVSGAHARTEKTQENLP
jgi:hypothetical protein